LNLMMRVAIAVDLGAFGRRGMFGAGLLLFVVASAVCALATSAD